MAKILLSMPDLRRRAWCAPFDDQFGEGAVAAADIDPS